MIESAIDVNKPDGGVQYFHPTRLDPAKFNPVSGMANGYHPLIRNASSGALDHQRNPLIAEPLQGRPSRKRSVRPPLHCAPWRVY